MVAANRSRQLSIALLALFAVACAGVAGQGTSQAMRTAPDVFRMVDRVVEARPWSTDTVTKVTGVRLERDAQQSNEFFTIYRSTASAPFERVELRVPARAADAKGGLLLLDMRANTVSAGDVEGRFGAPTDITDPSPHAQDAPTYLVYARPWGKLSFGFQSSGQRELVRVVFDATGL